VAALITVPCKGCPAPRSLSSSAYSQTDCSKRPSARLLKKGHPLPGSSSQAISPLQLKNVSFVSSLVTHTSGDLTSPQAPAYTPYSITLLPTSGTARGNEGFELGRVTERGSNGEFTSHISRFACGRTHRPFGKPVWTGNSATGRRESFGAGMRGTLGDLGVSRLIRTSHVIAS